MNKCCNVSNPLRRDGTSQKQRFAQALAESYVQIDERSHADILNFTLGLSREINYYDETNQIVGTSGWLDFFKSDASFVLANLYLLDIEAYKREFSDRMQMVMDFYSSNPLDFEGHNQLSKLFEYFLNAFPSPFNPNANLVPFPKLLDDLIGSLPDSSLFADELQFSFRDLVIDSRKRLVSVLKKVNVAQMEGVYSYLAMVTDGGGWLALQPEWETEPITAPDPGYIFAYFNSTHAKDIPKATDLLQLCQDTFVGILENLKANIPTFLEQSLGKYPWHVPQNGLFLAFLQLFDYAKTHLNRLGRKHLLYYYEDVLRFTAQKAVSDEAALIFQLRKGVSRHLIPAGTLLKAGKDPDGKALFYEVPEENVLNQAAVKSLKNVFIERGLAPGATASTTVITGEDPEPNQSVTSRVVNIYAAPIANSSDGIGGELDKDEPKWNMFGEAQSLLDDDSHTMPDAQLGFAVASPLLVLHEGKREVLMTFVLSSQNGLGEYILPTTDNAIAAREYALLHGLKAEYTMEKGWGEARIAQVFLTISQTHLDRYNAVDPTVVIEKPTGWSFTSGCLLTLRIVLDEQTKACLAYNEEVHAAGMNTQWPVMRLTFQGQSQSVESLQVPAFIPNVNQPNNSLHLFGGQLHKYTFVVRQGGNQLLALVQHKPTLLSELTEITLEDAIAIKYPAYQPLTTYVLTTTKIRVIWDSVAYELIASYDETPTGQGVTPPSTQYWEEVDFDDYVYDYLQYFTTKQVMLRVDVSGINGVVLENDASKLKTNKPFQPFGGVPQLGSRFYIGSQEIFGKKLTKLAISLNWQNLPSPLATYFNKYSGSLSEADWTVDAEYLYDGKWSALGTKKLFVDSNNAATDSTLLSFTSTDFSKFQRDLSLVEPTKLEPTTARGFIRLELSGPTFAFGHGAYRDLYVKEAMRVAKVLAGKGGDDTDPDPSFPNEPFAPTVKDFSISYSSRADIDFGVKSDDATSFNSRVEQFFHIHPFGQTEEHPYLRDGDLSLVPKLPDEGYLYLGFEGLEPPSTLSLLYQLVEGSGNPDLELRKPEWSYLADNQWVDLEAKDILTDTTVGMITSGVMRYNLETEMSTGNTLLDSSLHWMRAKVDRNVEANLQVIDIRAQAVVARFTDRSNNLAHLATSLPQGTINGLFINDPEVKKVEQPYASTGGKLPEQSDAFLTRVSERLRHKQRSVNVWDYERMVLEAFPEIYKVKCLNHTELQATYLSGMDWEISPGHVTVICIPDLRNRNAVNPFEPKTSVHTLKAVTTYLEKYTSSWVDLRVANPLYEQLRISCTIGFITGKDPGYYIGQLETAIQQFLSPWAFDHQEEIVFGNSVHRSQIIRFIEQQDYVDYVISFKMDHIKGLEVDANVAEAKATTGRSIIVSALKHNIVSGDASASDCADSDPGTGEPPETCCSCAPA